MKFMKNMCLKSILYLAAFSSALSCQSLPKEIQNTHHESFHDRFKFINFDSKASGTLDAEGPFSFQEALDQTFTLAPHDAIDVDMFIPSQIGTSPLVIFIHGNNFSKSAHKIQAQNLASWGFHVLTVNAPNTQQWLENGHRIKKLVKMIYGVPSLISPKVDRNKIILVGHSFGGSAVITAAAQGAPIKGLILLDPAVYDDIIIDYQKKLTKPVIVLGADPKVFLSRRRSTFSENISAPYAEISVIGATHNDAQYPTLKQSSPWDIEFDAQTSHQKTFKTLILASAISIASENLDKRLNSYFDLQKARGKITINLSRLQSIANSPSESKSIRRNF